MGFKDELGFCQVNTITCIGEEQELECKLSKGRNKDRRMRDHKRIVALMDCRFLEKTEG